MKRSKDEDKDEAVASTVTVANNNNNAKLSNNNASPNISSSSNDANGGTPGTAGTVRTTGRVKKPKQVYDPSDNYISRGSRNSLPAPTSAPAPSPSPAAVPAVAAAAAAVSQAAPQTPAPAQNSSVSTQQHQQQHPHQQTSNINANEISSVGEESADANANSVAMPSAEQLRNYDTCIKCSKSEPKRGSGYKSNYLACKACTLKWHFSCLPITFEILTNARKRYKCEDCRRCRLCVSNKGNDKLTDLVMCCVCVNVYHLECHWPRVSPTKLTDPNWKCYSCDPSYNALDTDDDVAQIESESPPRKSKAGRKKRATSDPAPANAKKMAIAKQLITKNGNDADDCNTDEKPVALCDTSLVPNQESEVTKSTDKETEQSPKSLAQSPPSTTPINDFIPPPIPIEDKENENGEVTQTDVAEMPQGFQKPVQTWNVDQVVSYVGKFYPQESNIFKVQEIDGVALMVLTRQDIIDRFGLKLGPALRLYELILSLQSSRDDVTLGWCD